MEEPTDMDVTNGTQQPDTDTDAANIDSVIGDPDQSIVPETTTNGQPEPINEQPLESTTEELLESSTGEPHEAVTGEPQESITGESQDLSTGELQARMDDEPLEPINKDSQESDIEELFDDGSLGPINEDSLESDIEELLDNKPLDEQSTMEHSDDLTSHMGMVDQGEQQTAELSEDPIGQLPDIEDSDEPTLDTEMIDQGEQQIAELSEDPIGQLPAIEDSDEPTLDTEMIDQIEQQTVQHTEISALGAHIIDKDNQETVAHPGVPVVENETHDKDKQETIVHSIEEGFDQVPDSSVEVEVDATTVEFTEDPKESRHREVSATLFVTGRSPSVQPAAQMPPPVLPASASRPIMSGNSTFARIRNLQQRIQQKKKAAMQGSRSMLRQDQPTPDPEALLESIISPRMSGPEAESSVAVDDTDNEYRMAEKEDQKAVEDYKKAKNHFDSLRRANNGSLTFKQDVEWLKIQGAEDTRRKKRKRDQARAQAEQSLFPDTTDSRETNSFDHDDESDLDTQQGTRKRQRPELPRKQPKQLSVQDAEMRSMMVALEANGDMPKKKSSGQADPDDSQGTRGSAQKKGSKSKGSRVSKSKASGKKSAKAPRQSVKDKRNAQNAVHQVTSLFASNVFEQQAPQDAPDQPTFRSRNKQDALKELIASVPLNDKKAVRDDAKNLMQATKDFDGRGSARSDGKGMWLVKGMKTSLKPYQLLGSAFMRRRENSIEEPRGGLVADQMGLGN
jgi:hypothetical protein